MKQLLLFSCLFIAVKLSSAQVSHARIVYDLASQDTADQSTVLRQFNNILKQAPDAELEVVCHGPAVYMLVTDRSLFLQRMTDLKQKGSVSFKACANSMRRLGIDKSQLLTLAEVVPVAILELADKQQKGWSYIKAGD